MDWSTAAVAAVAALGPYLTKAGERAAQKIGEDLYSWLRKQFEDDKDEDSQTALSTLEATPSSETDRDVLIELIAERAQDDADGFGAELQHRIQQIVSTENQVGALVGQIVAGKLA